MNKRFLIKDSVFYYDDRKYRIEIAIDVDSEVVCQTPYYYARSESILNGCLQQAFSDASPEAALGQIHSYVGRTFSCDRVYIFELDGDSANNTYEWCDPSAAPQQEILQNLPISFISWWIDLFEKNELVMIKDLGRSGPSIPLPMQCSSRRRSSGWLPDRSFRMASWWAFSAWTIRTRI